MVKEHIKYPGNFPLSSAVIYDSSSKVMEISGQIGIDFESKKLVEGVKHQTRLAMKHVVEVLENKGWGINDLVKVRIFLTDLKNYEVVNEVYASFFEGKYPARTVVEVSALPAGALIEIEAIAIKEV